MARPQIHATDHMLDVARELVLTGGMRAATVDQVVARSGAPKGSIYHRFPTVHDLLAATWLRAAQGAQRRFFEASEDPDPLAAAVAAGLATLDYAEAQGQDARLLAATRREDLLGGVTDPAIASALIAANDAMAEAIRQLARRLYGRASRPAVEQILLATVDLPLGAVRRHLDAGTPPSPRLRVQLEAAIRAALAA